MIKWSGLKYHTDSKVGGFKPISIIGVQNTATCQTQVMEIGNSRRLCCLVRLRVTPILPVGIQISAHAQTSAIRPYWLPSSGVTYQRFDAVGNRAGAHAHKYNLVREESQMNQPPSSCINSYSMKIIQSGTITMKFVAIFPLILVHSFKPFEWSYWT